MKINKIISLSLCTFALILVASCGKNEKKSAETTAGSISSLNDEAAAEATAETAGEAAAETAGEATAEAAAETTVSAPVIGPVADTQGGPGNDYIDLTEMSSTMVYSEVYNMMYYPENYIGKTIRMDGQYAVFYDENKDKYYHACIIMDATACCSQGIEFELKEGSTDPASYPEDGTQICVTGRFEIYHEDGFAYCVLRDAEFA